jgi:streptolysin S family bacteriocin protoxin
MPGSPEKGGDDVKLSTQVKASDKYDSANVVVAPGGWCSCTCTCCWCHCHISNATLADLDDEEL